MNLRNNTLFLGIACSILLASCSGSDSEPNSLANADSDNKITRQVPALVRGADDFDLDESGRYLRENVAITLEATSGTFAGFVGERLKVSAGTTVNISLGSPDAFAEMRIELVTSAPVLSVDELVSDAQNLSSISQPEVTSAGSRTLYFDGFSDTDTDASLTFNQDVEIQEVRIRTSKHLVNQEFTEEEVSIYAVRSDDGMGSTITRNVYADSLTDGKYIAVDGRYHREKVKATIEAIDGTFDGYVGNSLKIKADTTVKFSIDREAEFYALELNMVVPSGVTTAEQIVAASDEALLSLFINPDEQFQRLSVRSIEPGKAVTAQVTFLTDIVLKSGDLYGNELTVGF